MWKTGQVGWLFSNRQKKEKCGKIAEEEFYNKLFDETFTQKK